MRAYLLLFDRIRAIVPDDARRDLSYEANRLMDDRFGSFSPVNPGHDVIALDADGIRAFERALDAHTLAKRSAGEPKRKFRLSISPTGSIAAPGYAFVRYEKFGHHIKEMLEARGLLVKGGAGILKAAGHENYEIVDDFPAMLIMARLADKLSDRLGIPAISDVPWAHGLNRAIGLGLSNRQMRRGYLTNLLIRASIPAHLAEISDQEFERIRAEYEGVRNVFSCFVRQTSVLYLEDPADYDEFCRIAKEIAFEFREEIRAVRRAANAQFVRRWIGLPVAVCAFVAKRALPGFGDALADTLQIATEGAKEVGLIGGNHGNPLPKMMSGMRDEIAHSANFMRWIGDD